MSAPSRDDLIAVLHEVWEHRFIRFDLAGTHLVVMIGDATLAEPIDLDGKDRREVVVELDQAVNRIYHRVNDALRPKGTQMPRPMAIILENALVRDGEDDEYYGVIVSLGDDDDERITLRPKEVECVKAIRLDPEELEDALTFLRSDEDRLP